MGQKFRTFSNAFETRPGNDNYVVKILLLRLNYSNTVPFFIFPVIAINNLSYFLLTMLYFQLLLLQESWKELFLLYLAQWSIPWDLSALLSSSKARDRLPQDEITANEIKTIQELIGRFRQLSPDLSECGCMKAVILFTPGKKKGPCNISSSQADRFDINTSFFQRLLDFAMCNL